MGFEDILKGTGRTTRAVEAAIFKAYEYCGRYSSLFVYSEKSEDALILAHALFGINKQITLKNKEAGHKQDAEIEEIAKEEGENFFRIFSPIYKKESTFFAIRSGECPIPKKKVAGEYGFTSYIFFCPQSYFNRKLDTIFKHSDSSYEKGWLESRFMQHIGWSFSFKAGFFKRDGLFFDHSMVFGSDLCLEFRASLEKETHRFNHFNSPVPETVLHDLAEAQGWLSRLYSAYDWRLELALPTLARASSLAEDDLVASHFQAVLQDWTRWARERRKARHEAD